ERRHRPAGCRRHARGPGEHRGAALGRRPRGGHARRRRPRARDQRRRPRPALRHRRPQRRGRPGGHARHDADVGGLPADRRDRGPGPRRPHPGRWRGAGQRRAHQLGLDAAVGPGQDHRRRTRAAARAGLHRL
ncbi:MAG: PaaD-like protein (DUF59) involved in Fe-S cluster assembly, partial [uncultured Actinomycetospora sp.]